MSLKGRRGKPEDDAYPSPTDAEIASVRDESWRFTSTAKKSAGNRTPNTEGRISDYWEFSGSAEDSFYDASDKTPEMSFGKRESRTSARKVTTSALAGKYNSRIDDEDIARAAVRKSGLDPRDVVSTPGTTSAMLKYVGQMYVSELRSEMNILNVPYVTLDEVILDFIELAKTKKPSSLTAKVKGAITEQYIMSMKTDDFLLMLHEFDDEPGYSEVATLKRALAIAITSKGALSSSDSDSD